MGMIPDSEKGKIKKELEGLVKPVKLVNFSQELECQYCRETKNLMMDVAELSDKITAESYNLITDKEIAQKYNVEQIPATVITAADDGNSRIKFYGIPSGYEFVSLLEAIKMVSTGESGLSPTGKEFLKTLNKPVDLQVFITPTCPYCPRAVILAYQMAYESPLVTAAGIEVIEFPHLGNKYEVRGVPRTIINDKVPLEGAAPESMLIESIKMAITEEH